MTVQQTPLGPLFWEARSWTSNSMPAAVFAGREVKVHIYSGEAAHSKSIEADLIAALQNFFALQREHADEIIPHLWSYYCYVRAKVDWPVPAIAESRLIWSHVHPKVIEPIRSHDGQVYVSVEAECDWELEHGVQLVLKDGMRWVRVSDYSGHLTDGDSLACPALDAWMVDPAAMLPVRTSAEMLAIAQGTKSKSKQDQL